MTKTSSVPPNMGITRQILLEYAKQEEHIIATRIALDTIEQLGRELDEACSMIAEFAADAEMVCENPCGDCQACRAAERCKNDA